MTTTPIIPHTDYQPGVRAFIEPPQSFLEVSAILQLRNRVLSAGLDPCPRCDGLGVTSREPVCSLCAGTGNAAGRAT